MSPRDRLTFVVGAFLVALTAGCIAIHLPPGEVEVQERDIRFIKLGETTRDEVLKTLGPGNILNARQTGVNEWATAPGYGIFAVGMFGGSGPTGSNESRLLVEYDRSGKVRHFAFAQYTYPGIGVYGKGPPPTYFVNGKAFELPTPAAYLLIPKRVLAFDSKFSTFGELIISRDGRYVAASSMLTDGVQLLDLESGAMRRFTANVKYRWFTGDRPEAIDISIDGRFLAATSVYDSAVIWDIKSGKQLQAFFGHGESTFTERRGASTVRFSPDGNTVATGGRHGAVKVWDVTSGRQLFSFQTGDAEIQSLAFAPQGDLLAVDTARGDVIIIGLPAGDYVRLTKSPGELEHSLEPNPPAHPPAQRARQVAFSPSGKVVAANSCVDLELWRVGDIRERLGRRPSAANKHTQPDSSVFPFKVFLLPYLYGGFTNCMGPHPNFAFSQDEKLLLAFTPLYSLWDLSSDGLLAVWDPRGFRFPAFTLGPGSALSVQVSNKKVEILDLAPIISLYARNKTRLERSGVE